VLLGSLGSRFLQLEAANKRLEAEKGELRAQLDLKRASFKETAREFGSLLGWPSNLPAAPLTISGCLQA
jgi:hypothetical protein